MKELLYNTALETGINLTDIQLEKFQIYYNLLIETNKVMNLTSITEEKDVVLKHFIDRRMKTIFTAVTIQNVYSM